MTFVNKLDFNKGEFLKDKSDYFNEYDV